MFYLSWYKNADPEKRNKSLISVLLYGVAAALLILVVTGRIPWLFAIAGAAAPWINRLLTVKRLWGVFGKAGSAHASANVPEDPSSMTKSQAYEVLGLKPDASEEEIVDAHRKLIQKNHPDRGGSDFIAAKINQAKDVLLS